MIGDDIDAQTKRNDQVVMAKARAGEKFSSLGWSFLLRGLLALGLGLLLLVWPMDSVSTLLRFAGAFIAIDGFLSIFGQRRSGGSMGDLAPGSASVLIGAALLFFPAASAKLAFLLIGLWVFVSGAGLLLSWWRSPIEDRTRPEVRNAAILAMVVGTVLFFLPQTGLVAVGWTLAIVVLVVSAVLLFLATRFRRLGNRLSG